MVSLGKTTESVRKFFPRLRQLDRQLPIVGEGKENETGRPEISAYVFIRKSSMTCP